MQQFWSRSHSTRPRSTPGPTVVAKPSTPPHDAIAALAYSYWEQRGRTPGSDLEDWLRAERELRSGTKP